MNCTTCGKILLEGDMYCSGCGASVQHQQILAIQQKAESVSSPNPVTKKHKNNQCKLKFFYLSIDPNEFFDLFTHNNTMNDILFTALEPYQNHPEKFEVRANHPLIMQIYSLSNSHVFGTIGKFPIMSDTVQFRATTDLSIMEGYESTISPENFTYFYMDILSNSILIIENPSLPSAYAYIEQFLQQKLKKRISIVPVIYRDEEEILAQIKCLYKISIDYKGPEKSRQYLSKLDDLKESTNEIESMRVILGLQPQSRGKDILEKIFRKKEEYDSLTISVELENQVKTTVDLIKGELQKTEIIDLDNLENNEKNRVIIEKTLKEHATQII